MEFQVGDKVMLKVSPWKGVVCFGKRRKLNPRYVGPFRVLERVGDVAYKIDLPEELSKVHNTFHVSNLKKCHADEPLAVPLDGLHFDDKLHFMEKPVEIVNLEVKRYVGPFKVLERVGDVAYKLDLPEELSRVHNTFHVSNLKKCHVDEPLAVTLDGLHFDDKLYFVEDPVEIVDHEVKRLKTITYYECGNQGRYRSDCPVLKNQGTEARGRVYALGGGETNQDLDNAGDDFNA
nr:putative reverse transcriptase domain-containing protein [Tanacetum cinerariifolium]